MRVHTKKSDVYQKQVLQKELEATKVSVAYIHQGYSITRSCYS